MSPIFWPVTRLLTNLFSLSNRLLKVVSDFVTGVIGQLQVGECIVSIPVIFPFAKVLMWSCIYLRHLITNMTRHAVQMLANHRNPVGFTKH